MKNSRVTLNLLDRDNHALVGYKEVTCHLIFCVKIDLTRKSRYVAGGHITYVTMVGRGSVLLSFLIAALNGLDVLSGDINNAYVNAPTKDRVFFYNGD